MLERLEGKELPELLSVWTLNVGQMFVATGTTVEDTPVYMYRSVYTRSNSQWHTRTRQLLSSRLPPSLWDPRFGAY